MLLRTILICIMGFSFGLLVSAGVFTVLFVVGLVPRFAGKTNTARYELLYEECIIFGSTAACIISVFPIQGSLGLFKINLTFLGWLILLVFGVFSGIFVGCLAIALAEVLDGIPIFARRIKLKMGLEIAILAVAIGKVTGSLIYFILGFFE
ncbi:MAG: stage V sporulation protein AB [Lachnospiraceae bacterium]|nr:stage V sporulation protein AB [Lachnospiraceae bacterium]